MILHIVLQFISFCSLQMYMQEIASLWNYQVKVIHILSFITCYQLCSKEGIYEVTFSPTDLPRHFIKNLKSLAISFGRCYLAVVFVSNFSLLSEVECLVIPSCLSITSVCFSIGSLMLLICKSSLYMEESSHLFSDKLQVFSTVNHIILSLCRKM